LAPPKGEHRIADRELSGEQIAAVRHVLHSTDSVILVRGRAGVGKTRLLREVIDAIEATGRMVQAAAPTAMATHEVLRPDFTNAETVARILKDPALQERLRGQVLWVDEAGLLSMPDLRRLVSLTRQCNARLLLTGDTRQHRSVIRGDAMRLLEAESGLRIAEVKRVRRQRDERTGREQRLPLEAAERFAVMQRSDLAITDGDRVRITRGGRTACGKHKVVNGAIYTVDAINADGSIRLANGWRLARDFGHLAHGYCTTSDSAQGRTVDHAILVQSAASRGASHLQQVYTSVTRGRHQLTILTDDRWELLASVQRDASPMSATKLMRTGVSIDRLSRSGLTPPRERGLQHRRSIRAWLSR
jgi:ATP-dependent exoDNAse (exonuclease V) alpha subunit